MLFFFFENLTPGQATLISSIVSALVALIVVLITRKIEKRKSEKEKYDTAKKYANPIIFASELLAWRLKEILEFNGAYLLPNAPANGFFKYKFDSTIFRLCAVLGWIQAAKKEQSYIEGIKVKHYKKIQHSISVFQKALADGSHVEVSILDDLIKLFNLKPNVLAQNERALVGVELEKIIFRYIPDNVKKNVGTINRTEQIKMIQEIMDFICSTTKQSKIKTEVIEEKIATAIQEVSREFCWIYRDWQSAIGDVMLEQIEDANRRFDVIGFADFQKKHIDDVWLQKVDNLFSNLDVSIDDKFDLRVKQLKHIFEATIQLITTFKEIVRSQESIPDASYYKLKEFNMKINNQALNKKKRRLKIKISFE